MSTFQINGIKLGKAGVEIQCLREVGLGHRNLDRCHQTLRRCHICAQNQ
jgi:hypothetical protein